jgi:hypothetical protein
VLSKTPREIAEAAERRSRARAERNWAAADRLRAEIEAAGWRVIDSGTDYRLVPSHPPEVSAAGTIRYGRSEAVPSRLADPETGAATVVMVVSDVAPEALTSIRAARTALPGGVDLVLAADGLNAAGHGDALEAAGGRPPAEVVWTSALLGQGAALNIGIRRSRAPVVVVLDPSIEVGGDVVTPLVAALGDPTVAIAGAFGLLTSDLRHFEEAGGESTVRDVAAVQGYLMAFRRADAIDRGPIDEHFRFYRNLDIWWSLVLRDEGPDRPPRRAVVVPDLPVRRREPRAWTATPVAERDRLSKRNFYRVLDRFRTRADLAVPG